MKIEKAKPLEIPKDPEKAEAERLAKRKERGSVVLFIVAMGLAIWFLKSPATFKAVFSYITGLSQ